MVRANSHQIRPVEHRAAILAFDDVVGISSGPRASRNLASTASFPHHALSHRLPIAGEQLWVGDLRRWLDAAQVGSLDPWRQHRELRHGPPMEMPAG